MENKQKLNKTELDLKNIESKKNKKTIGDRIYNIFGILLTIIIILTIIGWILRMVLMIFFYVPFTNSGYGKIFEKLGTFILGIFALFLFGGIIIFCIYELFISIYDYFRYGIKPNNPFKDIDIKPSTIFKIIAKLIYKFFG